jgi:hypothetical protein
MAFIPPNPDRIPQIWGIPSAVVGGQKSVPDGPHDWERMVDGLLTKCAKCGISVHVGTADPRRTLHRLAGELCSDFLAMEVMES